MLEQVEVLWKARDPVQSCVSGRLLRRNSPRNCCDQSNLEEKWFTLAGHLLFCCSCEDSADYSGVYLTDVFGPAAAGVDQKTLDSFDIKEGQQVRKLITNQI